MDRSWTAATRFWCIRAIGAVLVLLSITLGLVVPVEASARSRPPRVGLVAAFAFNEGAGTIVQDASGHGHAGTIEGASWTTGRYGRALHFNGADSWVTIPGAPDFDFTSAFTLMAWVYPTPGFGVQVIVTKEGERGGYTLHLKNTRGHPEASIYAGGQMLAAEGSGLWANAWIHMAVSFDGTRLRLFVNGMEVARQRVSGMLEVSGGPLRIGGSSLWREFFRGRIDEVRIYNRALNGAEIQTDLETPIQ